MSRCRTAVLICTAWVFALGCGGIPRGDEQTVAESNADNSSGPGVMELYQRAQQAEQAQDWSAARTAYIAGLELAPNAPALVLALARTEARLEEVDACLERLELLARVGATADLDGDEAIAPLLARPELQAVAERLRQNAAPHSAAEVLTTFEDAELWPEGIAIDPATGDLYVGSIKRRAVFRISADGQPEELGASSEDGLLEVLGLWVDAERRQLWAATGLGDDSPPFEGEPRRNELVQYDLESGSLVARFPAPDDQPRLLDDVVVAPDGTAYVTESLRGELYRVPPGGQFELMRTFSGVLYLNGIAISGDGSMLYLAHYGGLSALDLASGVVTAVTGEDMTLGSGDGLAWADGDLFLIQNSRMLNMRVVRIALDDTGLRAVNLQVLPCGLPDGLIPYTCAVSGDSVFVVAAGSFDLLDRGEAPPAPVVVRVPVDTIS